MSQDFCPKDLPTEFFNGTRRDRQRRRGRPKMNWRRTIDRDLQMVNRRWSDALRVAADRARWSTWTASRVARRESNEDQVLLAVCPLASFSGRHTVMIFLRSDWIRVER